MLSGLYAVIFWISERPLYLIVESLCCQILTQWVTTAVFYCEIFMLSDSESVSDHFILLWDLYAVRFWISEWPLYYTVKSLCCQILNQWVTTAFYCDAARLWISEWQLYFIVRSLCCQILNQWVTTVFYCEIFMLSDSESVSDHFILLWDLYAARFWISGRPLYFVVRSLCCQIMN